MWIRSAAIPRRRCSASHVVVSDMTVDMWQWCHDRVNLSTRAYITGSGHITNVCPNDITIGWTYHVD